MKLKSLCLGLFVVLGLGLARPSFSQSTTITASHIQSDLSGTPLASGYFQLTPVNSSNQPTGFTSASGQVLPNAYYWPITAGAISGVVVPDIADTIPSNIGYQVTITNTSKQPLYTFPQAIHPTGTTWSFDAWSPTSTVIASPPTAVSSGNPVPTGFCTAPSLYYTPSAIYTCVGSLWTLLSSGGGSAMSINGVQGAFTFAGPGQSCTGTTCTFNGGGGGSAVASVFTRTGSVVATTGDYTAAQVTNAAATNASNTFTASQTISAATSVLNLTDTSTGANAFLQSEFSGLEIGSNALSIALYNDGLEVLTSTDFCWTAQFFFQACDTGVSRVAPNIVAVGSGLPGDASGWLQAAAIGNGASGDTDLRGHITLASGTGTYSFTKTYTVAPTCVATDTTSAAAVKASATTTVLTLTGTGTDVLNYMCAD